MDTHFYYTVIDFLDSGSDFFRVWGEGERWRPKNDHIYLWTH